ncbi:MAG: DNA-binding protein Alba [Thermoprotei archaeon]|nr:MAG: DNA-binding protein Alba [Thermoprotei archaeon]RLF03520.1 MAG: DNA-binding protein Alba [Thermoprotei archaeon]
MAAAEGVVFVGNKPTPNYVLAIATQFNQGVKKVIIKARGRAITRAVDAAELTKRFLPGKVEVEEVKIGSDKVGEAGKERTVSTIEIVLVYKEE